MTVAAFSVVSNIGAPWGDRVFEGVNVMVEKDFDEKVKKKVEEEVVRHMERIIPRMVYQAVDEKLAAFDQKLLQGGFFGDLGDKKETELGNNKLARIHKFRGTAIKHQTPAGAKQSKDIEDAVLWKLDDKSKEKIVRGLADLEKRLQWYDDADIIPRYEICIRLKNSSPLIFNWALPETDLDDRGGFRKMGFQDCFDFFRYPRDQRNRFLRLCREFFAMLFQGHDDSGRSIFSEDADNPDPADPADAKKRIPSDEKFKILSREVLLEKFEVFTRFTREVIPQMAGSTEYDKFRSKFESISEISRMTVLSDKLRGARYQGDLTEDIVRSDGSMMRLTGKEGAWINYLGFPSVRNFFSYPAEDRDEFLSAVHNVILDLTDGNSRFLSSLSPDQVEQLILHLREEIQALKESLLIVSGDKTD